MWIFISSHDKGAGRARHVLAFVLASSPFYPYIGGAELRGACWISIPGALSISKGAVPGLARGLGHMAPTYVVGSRDRYPTAIAAPRLQIIKPVASCSSPSRRSAHRLWRGAARRALRPPLLTPRISRPKASLSSSVCVRRLSRPIFRSRANPRPCRSSKILRKPASKRLCRSPGGVARPWCSGCGGLANQPSEGKWRSRSLCPPRRKPRPIFCSCHWPRSIAWGTGSAMARASTTAPWRSCGPKSRFARLESLMRARSSQKFPTRTTMRSLDYVLTERELMSCRVLR